MSGTLETDKNDRKTTTLKDEEIVVELANLRTRLMSMRSQRVSEKVEDTSQFGKIKRDISRLEGERTRRANA